MHIYANIYMYVYIYGNMLQQVAYQSTNLNVGHSIPSKMSFLSHITAQTKGCSGIGRLRCEIKNRIVVTLRNTKDFFSQNANF